MKKSVADIEKLVKRWRKRLGLTHWTVTVKSSGPLENESAILEVHRHDDAHRAVIFVAPWLISGEPFDADEEIDDRYVEQAVVHELCHLHFRDVVFPIRDDVEELFGQVTHALVMRQLSRAEEGAVDLMANALVKHWPKS